jgi:hypothetical protein
VKGHNKFKSEYDIIKYDKNPISHYYNRFIPDKEETKV